MEILIYLIIPCVGSVFLLGGMFYGAYRMSGDTDMPRRKIGIIAAYILVCIACSSLGNTWVNLLFQLLFPLVAWRVYGTPKIYCLYYLILSVAVWLTDVAAVLTFQILAAEGILYLNTPWLQYILLVAVTRMTEFMVILLVSMAVGHKAGRHITLRQVALSVLLPLYSVFNIYCMLYLIQIFPTKEMLVLLGINLALLIGLNIYFCVLVDIMSENHRLENERNLYRAQARMQHQYYEQEEEKYEASRKLIHDIRNHIQAMEALYARGTCPEGGQGKGRESVQREVREGARESVQGNVGESARGDIRRAEKYAGDIHRMLNSLQQKYYTSEKLLNIILNDKARTMKRLGVKEDMKVGELSLDFMKETDVTALFANLLDNAVAAAAESRDGYVRLRVNRVRQFLSVTVENSCDMAPVKSGSAFRSHKAGHEGLGLKIIRQTVEQYGGDVQMDWKEGVFTVRVMLAAEGSG
nr:sensor histidine kinase [uncultured Acetatifactor sp.]